MHANFLTPKAELRRIPGSDDAAQSTCVATAAIAAGETVAVFGGFVVTRAEAEQLDRSDGGRRSPSIQLDDDLFLVAGGDNGDEYGDGNGNGEVGVGHSCEPNCGMSGATMVVAMRDISAGEVLTYDPAMSNASAFGERECHCGAGNCRGKVTGEDWTLPDLQLRYRGFFSPYLARRIARLVPTGASRRAFAV